MNDNRGLFGQLTRLLAGMFGGEPNLLARPNLGRDLETLIESMYSLDDDEVGQLADSWQREDAATRGRAWSKVQADIAQSARRGELTEFRRIVGAWAAARPSDFQGMEGLLGSAGQAASRRQQAAGAIIDKAASLLGRERLDETESSVLSKPWDSLPGQSANASKAHT